MNRKDGLSERFARWRVALAILSSIAAPGCSREGGASGPPGPDCSVHELRDVSIPMRDGKSLAAFARVPTDGRCRLPSILLQTPYDKENARALWFAGAQAEPLFDSTDYAFVVVDWRGFFGSSAASPSPSTRGEDGYDTVEWIAAQPWSDGKVGTWGVSALCGQQYATAAEQPPHLAAAVPIFCGLNTTYQQYYPGGVLRREYFWFISSYYGAALVTSHPYRDAIWLAAEAAISPASIQVPVLVVAGWYDLHPKQSLETFGDLAALGDPEVRDRHRLLVGDWIHFAVGGETTGQPPTTEELRYHDLDKRVQADSLAFFDLHLRSLAGGAALWSPVRYVRSGAGTWESADGWPPAGTTRRTFYLTQGGALADAPDATGQRSFPYDPADFSPTVGGGTLLDVYAHGPTAQDAIVARGDALTFVTPAFASPFAIRGAISVTLDASTTGADTDFMVRLTDVDAAGSHILIGEGARRLKLRASLSAPVATSPSVRYTVPIALTADLAYTFAAGHRMGLIVTSSNYARFDLNPNTGADFWDAALGGTAVTNTLYLDGASAVVVDAD